MQGENLLWDKNPCISEIEMHALPEPLEIDCLAGALEIRLPCLVSGNRMS